MNRNIHHKTWPLMAGGLLVMAMLVRCNGPRRRALSQSEDSDVN